MFGGQRGKRVKQVFLARDVTEAHFVRGLLESHGLDAMVRGEDLWGTRGEVPFVDAWPTVWIVDDNREDDARALVQKYESGEVASTVGKTTWCCPRCQQEIEPQFTSCWACGADDS